MCAAISSGSRPTGQARTQLEQRIHGAGRVLPISRSVNASTPLVPFTTGTAAENNSMPIIGPPNTIRAGFWLKPPQYSNKLSTSVPIGTSRFPGAATAPPLTVTKRDTSGLPNRTASRTA